MRMCVIRLYLAIETERQLCDVLPFMHPSHPVHTLSSRNIGNLLVCTGTQKWAASKSGKTGARLSHASNKKTYPIENPLWERLNLASYEFFFFQKESFLYCILLCRTKSKPNQTKPYPFTTISTHESTIWCRHWAHERTTAKFHHIFPSHWLYNKCAKFVCVGFHRLHHRSLLLLLLLGSFSDVKNHNVWSILIISFESTSAWVRTSEMCQQSPQYIRIAIHKFSFEREWGRESIFKKRWGLWYGTLLPLLCDQYTPAAHRRYFICFCCVEMLSFPAKREIKIIIFRQRHH